MTKIPDARRLLTAAMRVLSEGPRTDLPFTDFRDTWHLASAISSRLAQMNMGDNVRAKEKTPDREMLEECWRAFNDLPNQTLRYSKKYGNTYALAAALTKQLKTTIDAEVEAEKKPDPDFDEARDLLCALVRSGGQGRQRDPWNRDLAISTDVWEKARAWVKAHEPEPKPKLTAEEVLRELHKKGSMLPPSARDLVKDWVQDNPEKQHGPTSLLVTPRFD